MSMVERTHTHILLLTTSTQYSWQLDHKKGGLPLPAGTPWVAEVSATTQAAIAEDCGGKMRIRTGWFIGRYLTKKLCRRRPFTAAAQESGRNLRASHAQVHCDYRCIEGDRARCGRSLSRAGLVGYRCCAQFSPTFSRSVYRDRPCRPESDLCSCQGLGRSWRRVWNREQCGRRQA